MPFLWSRHNLDQELMVEMITQNGTYKKMVYPFYGLDPSLNYQFHNPDLIIPKSSLGTRDSMSGIAEGGEFVVLDDTAPQDCPMAWNTSGGW